MVGQRKDNGGRRRTFVPGVEGLEERRVPAVLNPTCPGVGVVVFSATAPSSGNTNTLNLFDNGAGGITFNTGKTTDPAKALPSACGPVIHEIIYNASTGPDAVTYNMLKNASLQEDMQIEVVLPSAGNKGFTLTAGTPKTPFTPGSPGTPSKPPVFGVPVNIAGSLTVDIFGSINPDNATINYAGKLNGHLNTSYVSPHRTGPRAHGLDGDKVSFNFTPLANSHGVLRPKMRGGVGDDAFFLIVSNLKASPGLRVTGNPQVNGDGGNNTMTSGPASITGINV
jgi:hypothetical protein